MRGSPLKVQHVLRLQIKITCLDVMEFHRFMTMVLHHVLNCLQQILKLAHHMVYHVRYRGPTLKK